MLIPIFYAKDAKVRMRAVMNEIIKEINKQEKTEITVPDETLHSIKNKFFAVTTDMLIAFTEIKSVFKRGDSTMLWIVKGRLISSIIKESHERLKEASLQDMKNYIEAISEHFEEELESLSSHHYYEDSFVYKYSDLPYEKDFDQIIMFDMLRNLQLNQSRTINVIDASMRNPENMSSFKGASAHDVRMYAIGVKEDYVHRFRNAGFDRIALGNMRGAVISNEVFDVMVLSPRITLAKESMRLSEKKEYAAIKDSIKYLRPGGALLMALPKFRFHRDVCTLLAKAYCNFQIRSSIDGNNDEFVYLMAERKPLASSKEIDKEAYSALRGIFSNKTLAKIQEKSFEPITLPGQELEVTTFRGSILNKEELELIFQNSPCVDQLISEQLPSSSEQNMKEPLLPFTTGQLGLVLTSGALDGVIDEGNGYYHVVKGRVIKKKQHTKDSDEDENVATVIETIANQVEITAITADGTIKRLA